jgi:hypothetical protein
MKQELHIKSYTKIIKYLDTLQRNITSVGVGGDSVNTYDGIIMLVLNNKKFDNVL